MPATPAHASSRTLAPTRSARWFVAALVLFTGATVVRAEPPVIVGAATVSQRAERIPVESDGLQFPIAAQPVCEVFNNFGGFSKTFGSGGHQGLDIGADHRQEVYAVENGVLYREFSGGGSGIGWGLHGDSDTKYRYYHLDALVETLSVGDRVTTGQLIGWVGDTGNASPGGWHLHFEVRPGPAPHKTPVDPVPLLAIPADCNVY
ncbi:M23 family metallopeptidase [Ilumatobacter sp.]|uniref:M23 family metallopeptidase n=1 Tax=Ilumatobacter sp. TaxID=1967498 RepID=UPI003AF5DE07